VLEPFVPFHPFVTPQLLIGGADSAAEDIDQFQSIKPNVMIATPGRLHELLQLTTRTLFRAIQLLIIDEADQILKIGLQIHLSTILDAIPRQRRTGLFSATLSEALHDLIRTGMRNPIFLRIKSEAPVPTDLLNFYAIVHPDYKFVQLLHFLRTEADDSKVIIFVLTGAIVQYFSVIFNRFVDRRPILPLFGDMKPGEREKSLDDLRQVPNAILIATDIAARGIDIPDVDWIVQFDPPQDPSMFIHRVGRTARIGKKGSAILFLREHEDAYVEYMQQQQVGMFEKVVEIPEDADDVLNSLRAIAKVDNEFLLKAVKAMVSYARAYGEHRLKLLLQKREVDFVALGNSFGLVRLPVMPELNHNPKVHQYNEKFAEYAVNYQMTEAQERAKAMREMEKQQKKKKKQRTAEEEIIMYRKTHRGNPWFPRKK
jgi:ATP-dependent RNA helicase DDX55/SPB4